MPTLAAGETLAGCLRALAAQTLQDFEVIVIDNSGKGLAQDLCKGWGTRGRVIANVRNVGFGAAINQAFRASKAPFLAALNDDAEPGSQWLAALMAAADAYPRAGMFASCVMLDTSGVLDSAGMLLAVDGSSKQRGHGEPPQRFADASAALFPSGSAALYRRAMLDEIGLFEEDFFLYCEDTDLGLRARWAGWECVYAPEAVVEHQYSASAGRASPMKAYYVERNRLFCIARNFPLGMLSFALVASKLRYFWHVVALFWDLGKTAEYRRAGHDTWLLPFVVVRAHLVALYRLPSLWAARRRILANRRITVREFRTLAAAHAISLRKVASL